MSVPSISGIQYKTNVWKRMYRGTRCTVQKVLKIGPWAPPVDRLETKEEEISRTQADKCKNEMMEIYDKYLKNVKFPQLENAEVLVDVCDELTNSNISVIDYILEIYAAIERGVPPEDKEEIMKAVEDLDIDVSQNIFNRLIALRRAYRVHAAKHTALRGTNWEIV